MYFIFYDYIYIMSVFMSRKNNDNNEYNYIKYKDNRDNSIIYVGYLFLGLFLLAIFL